MSNNVLVLAGRVGKDITEATYELIGAARALASAWGGQVEVALFGTADPAKDLGAADTVISIDHPALSDYVPEAYETALRAVVAERAPRVMLLPNDTMGLDLGTAVSVHWEAAQAAYVVGLTADGETLVATCQILGGKILAECEITGPRAVCTVAAGAFPAAAGQGGDGAELVTMDPPAGLDSARMSLLALMEPSGGDVDITQAELLVSVGRGIGSKDDLDTVQELADALGAPLSASRPVIDAGWMPKSRQVGKSGLKVKPKAYLSFGISGAPEHLEGIRDAELIIACNTDAAAPIFDVAHFGTTADLFDLVPAIVEKLEG
jgi:electron transfer flavoprotein alpha subunit